MVQMLQKLQGVLSVQGMLCRVEVVSIILEARDLHWFPCHLPLFYYQLKLFEGSSSKSRLFLGEPRRVGIGRVVREPMGPEEL